MTCMKLRHRPPAAVARAPREIHVRLTAPRPGNEIPDVWVVNGRVIRFLDPSRPDVEAAPRRGRRFGLLPARTPH
jgi:hypothetical protein